MPYAHNGQISQSPIEGGIEITQQEYLSALEGMVAGQRVTIDGGFAVVDVPEPEPDEPAEVPNRLSALAFFERFTDSEYGAVRTGPIAIQRGLDSLIAAQYVDLLDPRVEQYLDALVQASIIDTERKAQLLEP